MPTILSAVQVLLSLVSTILPKVGVSPTGIVADIISGLQNIIPTLVAEAPVLLTQVQDLIASLRNGSTPLTVEQMDQLDAFEAILDAKFEADAVAAGAPPDPAIQG